MFADRLKLFRESLRISARQFALDNDIDSRTYNNYEAGSRIPNVIFLEAISFKYNVSLDWLILGQGAMYNSNSNSLKIKKSNNINDLFIKCGHRIMQIQEKNDLTNREMAKIIGVTETNYLKICAAKETPTEKELNNIKANFDVNIDWLMYGDINNGDMQNGKESSTMSFTPEEIKKLKKLLNNI